MRYVQSNYHAKTTETRSSLTRLFSISKIDFVNRMKLPIQKLVAVRNQPGDFQPVTSPVAPQQHSNTEGQGGFKNTKAPMVSRGSDHLLDEVCQLFGFPLTSSYILYSKNELPYASFSPSSAIPIFDKRYRSAFRDNPSNRAA